MLWEYKLLMSAGLIGFLSLICFVIWEDVERRAKLRVLAGWTIFVCMVVAALSILILIWFEPTVWSHFSPQRIER